MTEPMSDERWEEIEDNIHARDDRPRNFDAVENDRLFFLGATIDLLAEVDRLREESDERQRHILELEREVGDVQDLLDEVTCLRQWVHDCQSGMYINCVYCGHRYGPEDETPATMADALKEHIEGCPKHPMSALKAEVARLREKEANSEDEIDRLLVFKERALACLRNNTASPEYPSQGSLLAAFNRKWGYDYD